MRGGAVIDPWCAWASIGPHRVLAGDLLAGGTDALMRGERAAALYSDPPWGPGNLRYWHTHARPAAPRGDWSAFVAAFVRVCAAYVDPDGPVWVEMGLRWADDVAAALAGLRRPVATRWTTAYGAPARPCALLYVGAALPVGFDPSPLRGAILPRACLAACALPSGAVVLDPCCGKGYTARAAARLGLAFRGLELNPHRLGYTERWLRNRS